VCPWQPNGPQGDSVCYMVFQVLITAHELVSCKSGHAHNVQMALFLEGSQIKMLNVTSNSEEPDKLDVDTAGKQWLVAPNGAALLALRHGVAAAGGGGVGWALDAYALEECLPEQAMFQQIADALPLSDYMRRLPAAVRFRCDTQRAQHCAACQVALFGVPLCSILFQAEDGA
jgi:hypothetical protein